jgi:hypothetical protein
MQSNFQFNGEIMNFIFELKKQLNYVELLNTYDVIHSPINVIKILLF